MHNLRFEGVKDATKHEGELVKGERMSGIYVGKGVDEGIVLLETVAYEYDFLLVLLQSAFVL